MSLSLDIDVARALGLRIVKDEANSRGWQVGYSGRNGRDLPFYSNDVRHIAPLLADIKSRKCEDAYIRALAHILGTSLDGTVTDIWEFLEATPEQHCRAFIACHEQGDA